MTTISAEKGARALGHKEGVDLITRVETGAPCDLGSLVISIGHSGMDSV